MGSDSILSCAHVLFEPNGNFLQLLYLDRGSGMQRHLIDSEHLTYCYLLLFGLNYYKMITVIRLETDFINASYTIHKMGPLRLQNMLNRSTLAG